ncbi:hypothetical protein BOX15_Mlig018137g3 [Macrostomum lignano]|uniref:SH2 domain-containing protein n=1 Tax=Macrostomum lignano TaxID=282301 RepID=A0A267ETZ6_9PLAT|nr:hypothetical protein BOX15_Mlig014561g2 [Macrostomum lignano]PAA65010.1 hypothetical protein BOX15_Mlig018137g3 [Macrostomum lignano]
MSAENRLSQVLQLCEHDRNILEELRSLYNSLWNGFLTLKFRRIVDPVVLRHLRYLTEVDCANAQNDCIQRAYEFLNEVCQAVSDSYDSDIRSAGASEMAMTLEDEKMAELSVLKAKFEKEPHELVRLMQACLMEESRLLARTAAAESQGPASGAAPKRPSSSDSALLDAALDTNRKLRRIAVDQQQQPVPDPASLEAELRSQHEALVGQLNSRESLINSPSSGRDSDRLGRELSCVLDSLLRLYEANPLPRLAAMAGDLLTRSLLILTQDDQVIKQRKSNYCLSLRYLAGDFLQPDRLYEFKVGVLSDDCQSVETIEPQSSAGRAVRHCNSLGSRIDLRFSFPQLPAGRSCRRGRAADVCAQKRALEVYVNLAAPRLGHPSLRASARSLPVVFVTHDQQKAAAYATVCYDDLFRETDVFNDWRRLERRRGSFDVAPSVPAERALLMLDSLARRQLMQPLLSVHMDYFRRKLVALSDSATAEVTFDQIAKSKLAEFNSRSLWDFFYQCVRLIKQHCLSLWRHRLLLGFVEKAEAERLVLASNRPGAFLVRLSESTGRLSVTRCPRLGQAESLDPFTDAELQAAPLADRLFSEPGLVWLLDAEGRCLAKADALADHVNRSGAADRPPAADGYVPRRRGQTGDCGCGCGLLDASSLGESLP